MHIHPTVAEYLPVILAKLAPFAWKGGTLKVEKKK
jgi:hypothetical protein